MGFTANVVANTPITSTWGNEIRDRSNQVFASIAERTSQWTSPPEGSMSYLRDLDELHVYRASAWCGITPVTAQVQTADIFNGTVNTYAPILNPGPAVTILTGTSALVTLSSAANSTVNPNVHLGVVVSGASSIAASDANSAGPVTIAATSNITLGRTFALSGLTPGSNTFTMVYKSSTTGSGSPTVFLRRDITVVGIP